MLTVNNISKSFGVDAILRSVSFSLNPGEKIGLVGPNGCGKTTLLRILAGEVQPDAGSIHTSPGNLQIGYLPQGLSPDTDETITGFLSRLGGDPTSAATELERAALALEREPGNPDLQIQYDTALDRLQRLSQDHGQTAAIMAGLGFSALPLDTPVQHLSGGQKTRLALAGVLLANPRLLLLDEPTNHLDLEMLTWLEDWLLGFQGAALIVSHDRAFLDRVPTSILELDPQTRKVRMYAGNYTAYLEQKLADQEKQWQLFSDQNEEIDRLRQAIAHMRGIARFRRGGKADTGDKFAKGFFANRGKNTVRRAKHLEARLERMLTEDRVEKPQQSWQMKLDFSDTPTSSRDVARLENVSVGYSDHVLLHDITLNVRYKERIALIGPNGSGKTTLLRTVAGELPALSGKVFLGPSVRLGYLHQEQEDLNSALDAFTTIRSLAAFSDTEVRLFLHQFLFSGDDVFLPVGALSYGERTRLSLARLVASGCNFLLLDEPVNHLDIPSRARFEQALASFDGTVLAVVHDRYFIEGFASVIWEVQQGSIRTFLTS